MGMIQHNVALAQPATRRRSRPVLAVLKGALLCLGGLVLLAVVACNRSTGSANAPSPQTPPQARPPITLAAALDFPIKVTQGSKVLGGSEINFSSLFEQGKPVVLNFWAGLCPPCRLEMPDLQRMYEQYGDRVILLGLDVGPFTGLGSHEDGQRLLQQLGVTYPMGVTTEARVLHNYQVLGMPTTVFFRPDGTILVQRPGLLTNRQMNELVQRLLEASSPSEPSTRGRPMELLLLALRR